MININKYQNNNFVLYLNDLKTLDDPYFIFNFKDIYNEPTIVTLNDDSTSNKYNEFNFYESSTAVLGASGELFVYESSVDTSILSDCSLIYSTLYKLIKSKTENVIFDPSIYNVDSVFDPCSGYTGIDQDIVFDPVWVNGSNLPDTIVGNLIVKGNLTIEGNLIVDGSIFYNGTI